MESNCHLKIGQEQGQKAWMQRLLQNQRWWGKSWNIRVQSSFQNYYTPSVRDVLTSELGSCLTLETGIQTFLFKRIKKCIAQSWVFMISGANLIVASDDVRNPSGVSKGVGYMKYPGLLSLTCQSKPWQCF